MQRIFFDDMLYHAELVRWPFGVLAVMAVIVVAYGWFVRWGQGCCWGIGVLWVARFEMKRAGDLFPNHPKERTDSVRQ